MPLAPLPFESGRQYVALVYPSGGIRLYFLDNSGNGLVWLEADEQMDVIAYAIYRYRLLPFVLDNAVHVFAKLNGKFA